MASKRILLVEDEADVRALMQHVLLAAGYSVQVAETARQAALLIGKKSYDLVLTDGLLPDGTGGDIADKAKARGMKAVIITGNALRIPPEQLERHEYFLKPVRPSELLRIAARYLNPDILVTVLFVEDDIAVRDVVIKVLSHKGFGLFTAPDAEGALRILAEHPVDLLFADIVLPGMDGVELARQAKLMRPGIKLLFTTGFAKIAAERKAANYGKLLHKPLRAAQLLQEVQAALVA